MEATQRIFFPGPTSRPQLLEKKPEYTKENKVKSKLILIYTVLNQK
jgi:hypothetical protein